MSHLQAQEKAGKAQDSQPVDTKKDTTPRDPDLARVVADWPNLPVAVRHAIMALVDLSRCAAT